jgi:hypothetical protein
MLYDDALYYKTLKEIDRLRLMGVPSSDPLMLKTRIKLRDILEHRRKKNKTPVKLVPKITGIKTIILEPKQQDTQEIVQNPKTDDEKYAVMGVVVALLGVMWQFLQHHPQ